MEVLEPYLKSIEDLACGLTDHKNLADKLLHIEASLNGELSKTLRKLVPTKTLQDSGAFFTGELMADSLIDPFKSNVSLTEVVLDTSCGGGNLLLSYARHLPILRTLGETLYAWGRCLKGFDIHPQFVRACRTRLALLAAQRGITLHGHTFLTSSVPELEKAFPHILVANSLTVEWPKANIILLNPPFNIVPVTVGCRWATGRVSQAAQFIIKCLQDENSNGSTVRAILPDVLRSGSRYTKWRREVEKLSTIKEIKILGQFDHKTNVDVFLLTLSVVKPPESNRKNWTFTAPVDSQYKHETIGDLCDVKVGRVVPHRDLEEGPKYPYLDVKQLPPWTSITPGAAYRKFLGNVSETPFVIVRRNSRSKDVNRAVGTIVESNSSATSELVAVENHLLVLRPKSGSSDDCKKLLMILQDQRTNDWLNEQIRCRHLTVGAVQSIPWWV